MQKIFDQFLLGFQSQHTKSAYQKDLVQFFKFCDEKLQKKINHPNEIGETVCIMWFHVFQKTDIKLSTMSRKFAVISSFFKFCQRKKITNTNPVEFLNRPKKSNLEKTNILTKDEWFQVLDWIQKREEYANLIGNKIQFKLWKKRYTVIYVLFSVGMRVSELCQLKFEDLEKIDDTLYRLHLLAKGHKKHAPLIHYNTACVLLDYMKSFSINQNGQFIFENTCRSNIHNMIKKCVKNAGINKNVSAHSLRASLATHLHKIGVPLGYVKDLLNHKNIATTLLYTRVSDDELKENAKLLDF